MLVAGCFEYYADLAEKLDTRQGQALQLPMEEFKGAIRREPLGVVGLITPWNYPMLMAAVSSTSYAYIRGFDQGEMFRVHICRLVLAYQGGNI